MFAMVSTRLGVYLTTRLAHPFMFVAHAFPWFTTASPTAELVVKLAQALSFVTLDNVLLPILSRDQQDRDHRVLSSPHVRHVLLHNRRVCILADLFHHVLHDLRGPGVLLVARLTGCLLSHHVPDVSVLIRVRTNEPTRNQEVLNFLKP